MSHFHKFLISTYLKKFFFVFMFLQIFFVVLEFILIYEKIPPSANMVVLYIFYDFIFAMQIMFPIAVAVSFVLTMNYFVHSSEYVSFLSLGYSKQSIIKPIFLTSVALTIMFVGLNSTKLAYAEENKNAILDKKYINYSKEDIFIKYYNTYIYFKKLYVELHKVEDVRIFKFDDNKNLLQIIHAKEAYFKEDRWYIKNAKIINNNIKKEHFKSYLEIKEHQDIQTLSGFNPTMLSNIYNKKNLASILDAIDTMLVLKEQGINTKKHRIIIYQYGLTPFLAPAVILIIFFYIPYTPRIGRMALFSFLSIFSAVTTFGAFISITEIAQKIDVLPEFIIVAPILLIMLVALYKYKKMT